MCQHCGHPLEAHYSWSAGNVSGSECSACLYVSKGVYKPTGKGGCVFVPPKDYSVACVASGEGEKLVLVLSTSLVKV